MLAVSSSNHRQRSGRNLADGHVIPGSGLLLTTWQTPTLGFRKQGRMLRTGSTGGCLRSIAQRTHSGACSYWIGLQTAVQTSVTMNDNVSDKVVIFFNFYSYNFYKLLLHSLTYRLALCSRQSWLAVSF